MNGLAPRLLSPMALANPISFWQKPIGGGAGAQQRKITNGYEEAANGGMGMGNADAPKDFLPPFVGECHPLLSLPIQSLKQQGQLEGGGKLSKEQPRVKPHSSSSRESRGN
jgi:hypothetical protein